MASGIARAGGPLKSTGARRSISTPKPPGDYISTAQNNTTYRGAQSGNLKGQQVSYEGNRTSEGEQKANTVMKGPVAGYTDDQQEKSTEQVINDYTKGEQLGKERNRGRFDSNPEQSRDPNIRAGQKLDHGNTESQHEGGAEQAQKQAEEIREKESAEVIRKTGEEIEMNSKAPLPVVIPRKPMGGLGFYFVFLIVLTKDIIDIVWEIIEIFADVTIILGIIMWLISTLMDIIVLLTTNFYFWLEDIPKGSMKAKIQTISTIAEILPVVGFLPINTIAFVMIRMNENKRRKEEGKQMEEEVLEEREQQLANAQEVYVAINEMNRIEPRAWETANELGGTAYIRMQQIGYKPKDTSKSIPNHSSHSNPEKTPSPDAPSSLPTQKGTK